MNPVLALVITIIGGIVAGALGAMLAAPLLTAVVRMRATLAAYAERRESTGVDPAESG